MTTAPIGEWPGAAKPPNLGALRQIITQYGLTQASILPGPRVSPSGHLSRRCHPAPDPKGFALWTPSRRCRPAPGPKVSPLDTDQTLAALDSAQRACRPLHSRRSPRTPFLPLFSQRRFVLLGTLHAILHQRTYPFRTVILFSSCNAV